MNLGDAETPQSDGLLPHKFNKRVVFFLHLRLNLNKFKGLVKDHNIFDYVLINKTIDQEHSSSPGEPLSCMVYLFLCWFSDLFWFCRCLLIIYFLVLQAEQPCTSLVSEHNTGFSYYFYFFCSFSLKYEQLNIVKPSVFYNVSVL